MAARKTRAKKTNGSADAEDSREFEEKINLPRKEVRLLNGSTWNVKPWSLAIGADMTVKVVSLVRLLGNSFSTNPDDDPIPQEDIFKLITTAESEVKEVIRGTMGWTDDDIVNNCEYFEDIAILFKAVMDTSVKRGADQGLFPTILSAMNGIQETVGGSGV